jgi:hypothetical protein
MKVRTFFGLVACCLFAVSASAADFPVKAVVEPVPYMQVFGGFAADKNSYYGDLGADFAVNRNLYVDGWLVRINGGAGHYDYALTATTKQGVAFETGDLMAGYQWYTGGGVRVSLYGGAYVENHDNSDIAAIVRGTRAGVKGQAELYAPLSPNMYFFGMVNGTSVWDGYFGIAKLGFRVTPTFSIGPEVITLGNDRFGEARAGLFVAFSNIGGADIFLSGGYSWDTKRDNPFGNNDSAYGTLHVRRTF